MATTDCSQELARCSQEFAAKYIDTGHMAAES